MANVSSLHISFLLPTTSLARLSDAMAEIRKVIEDQKGRDISLTIQTPFEVSAATATEKTSGDGRLERGSGRDEEHAEDGKQGARRGSGDGDADDKPKRGRGRPRKSDAGDGDGAEEARSAGSNRGRGAGDAEAEEGSRGNEPRRTGKGSGQGDGDGEEGRGSARGRGDAERGDREAHRISSGKDRGEADEGWGDEEKKGGDWEDAEEDPRLVAARASGKYNWPDDLLPCDPDAIDKTVIQTLLGEHLASTGGKDKGPTFDIIDDVAGTRALGEVDERDYYKLAKALMKSTARNEFNLG